LSGSLSHATVGHRSPEGICLDGLFNGRHVHAVDATRGNRTAVSFLLRFIDDRTVVTWT
jgi:hypothetical protein